MSSVLFGFTNGNNDKDENIIEPKTAVSFNLNQSVSVYSYLDLLDEYYSDYTAYCDTVSLTVEVMTFNEFYDAFYAQDEYTILEFVAMLKDHIEQAEDYYGQFDDYDPPKTPVGTGSGPSKSDYSYDTVASMWQSGYGEDDPILFKPSYGKYSFDLQAGDIIHEDEGSSSNGQLMAGCVVRIYVYRKGGLYPRIYRQGGRSGCRT